jgi:hypothetical protein
MQLAPYVIGLTLLTAGLVVSLIGWLGIGRARRTLEWRVFDAQWGDLARYGGPALACFGAIVSFIEFGV